jgi:hypothetical protein
VQPTAASDQPASYRELWAGSALAVPIIQIAALTWTATGGELAPWRSYARARRPSAPRRGVALEWIWFTLQWRSPAGRFTSLALADLIATGQWIF